MINDLVLSFDLKESALGHLTSAVQFGFIIGTLVYAIFTIADRFSPSKVFFISALLGSLFNLGIIWEANTFGSLLSLRFLSGFFLAGIYPVGMKIAADYYEKGLGKSLGYIVGALVIGTAFPHLLKGIGSSYPWQYVLIATSILASLGGFLMIGLVPNGPFRKGIKSTNFSAFFRVFRKQEFRSATFGYLGHMWELYAFWAFVPILLKKHSLANPLAEVNIPLLSFLIIAIGGLASALSGHLAQAAGTKKVVSIVLFLSAICCLISPFLLTHSSRELFIGFLLFWGMVVIADSPLLSSLVAQSAPSEMRGTALTIVNCLGFSITIISIQLIASISLWSDSSYTYSLLSLGPLLALIALGRQNSGFMQTRKRA